MHNKKKTQVAGSRKKALRRQFDALLEQVQTTRVHFRNVVEKNIDGIVLLGDDNHILYLNPAAENLFDEARKDLIGQVWPYGVPLEDPFETVLRHHAPERSVEMRGVKTEWEGAPAVLISIRDITERMESEKAIRLLNQELENKVARRTEQLEALNRELEAFNYAVSHDLRTPLARIDGYASLLISEMAGKLDADNAHFLQRIRASVTQMVELTDGLLQLSRLTQRPLEPTPFCLSTLAENILETMRQDDPQRRAEITVQPGMNVCADYVLIRATMVNLLSNAWKFTRNTDITRIAVQSLEGTDETVYSVTDNGVGFDMNESSRLFQAFQRLHSDTGFPGTGIGLTTVRRIIHRHQGRVWAESKAMAGATFFFTLPVSAPGPTAPNAH
jgi:signal transduction histidine kinase